MASQLTINCKVKVNPFQPAVRPELELTVREILTMPQIGTSYKIEADIPSDPKRTNFFLKIPEPVDPSLRDSLRDRFHREFRRGQELNDLAGTIATLLPANEEWLFQLPKLEIAGLIYDVDGDTGHEFCGLPVIVYEWLEGHQLDKVIQGEVKDVNPFELRRHWFKFARGLTQIVARLHNHNFLHGYIVPRNILVSRKADGSFSCSLAGFGYSSLSIEEASQPVNEVPGDKAFQAPEFSSRRPLDALWHHADIFSVGAVVLYLATAEIPQPVGGSEKVSELKLRVRRSLMGAEAKLSKENVPVEQVDLGRVLRNDNVAKIIDNCLRQDPDERIATAEELVEAIEIANTQPLPSPSTSNPTLDGRDSDLGPFFSAVLHRRRTEFNEFETRTRARRHLPLYGSRTAIIEGLCRMLGGLGENAVYRTVTLPSYWTSKNLGPDGRFLAMNKHVARRGVKIERIFLVNGGFHTLSDEEQQILLSQQSAADELAKAKCPSFQVKVHTVSKQIVQGFERSGQSVAFVAWESSFLPLKEDTKVSGGRFLCLNFISRGEELNRYGKTVIVREIKKVRIWDPGRGDVYGDRLKQEAANFDHYWRHGSTLTLRQYIDEGSTLSLEELLARDSNTLPKNGKGAPIAAMRST